MTASGIGHAQFSRVGRAILSGRGRAASRSSAWCSRDCQIRERRPFDDLERPLELVRDAVEHETASRFERLGGSHDHLEPAEVAEEQATEVEVHVTGVATHAGERLGHGCDVRSVDVAYQRQAWGVYGGQDLENRIGV